MNERVTNGFALAASMCNILAPLCPRKCPFYGKDDCPVDPGDRDQFKALGAAVVEARKERDFARRTLDDHGPEGHNVTNQQFVELRNQNTRLHSALYQAELQMAQMEKDLRKDAEFQETLIEVRKALEVLPEQDQQKEIPHVD